MFFDGTLETMNLLPALYVLAFGGVLLAVYVMQTSWISLELGENVFVKNMRRASLVTLALSMMWTILYSERTGWQPWPSQVGVIFAADLMLAVRAIGLYARTHEGDDIGESQRQFSRLINNVVMFGFMVLLVLAAGMALDRTPPYERQVGEIIPAIAKSEEEVAIRWTGAVRRSCGGTVCRYITGADGRTRFLGCVPAIYAQVADSIDLIRYFRLPKLPPGPASYQAITSFVCNPMHKLFPIVVDGPVVRFSVE